MLGAHGVIRVRHGGCVGQRNRSSRITFVLRMHIMYLTYHCNTHADILARFMLARPALRRGWTPQHYRAAWRSISCMRAIFLRYAKDVQRAYHKNSYTRKISATKIFLAKETVGLRRTVLYLDRARAIWHKGAHDSFAVRCIHYVNCLRRQRC